MSDLHEALLKVQQSLPKVGKNATADTGKFSYDYATLSDTNEALLPLLNEHGLVWAVSGDGSKSFCGTVTHAESGEEEKSYWPMPSTDDPQRLGSALTYARRYLLCALVGLVPDGDDDGQAAAAPAAKPKSKAERAAELGVDWGALVEAYEGAEDKAVAAMRSESGLEWAREHCPAGGGS